MNDKIESAILTVWDERRKSYVDVSATRTVSGLFEFNPDVSTLTEDSVSFLIEHAIECFETKEHDDNAYYERPIMFFEDMPQEILDNEE